MFPTISIGPVSMPVPGLAMIIGIWVGLSLSERFASNFDVEENFLYNLTFTTLLAGILGARITYIASAPGSFVDDPLSIIALNITSLDPVGGLAIGIAAGLYYSHRKGMLSWKTLDALSPLAAVLYISMGVSHLASGKAFGTETNLPWGINLWNANRHPTQIYEIMLGILLLGWLWRTFHQFSLPAGQTFSSLILLLSLGHLFITGFRADLPVIAGGIRTGQLAAYAGLALSLWLVGKTMQTGGSAS